MYVSAEKECTFCRKKDVCFGGKKNVCFGGKGMFFR
jgi:hypothetical protein